MNKRTSVDCLIPHVPIPTGEFEEVVGLLYRANVLLLGHAQRLWGPRARGKRLREALFKGTVMPHAVGIGYEDGMTIFAARKYEERIICHHILMILKVANVARLSSKRLQVDDLVMEGVMAVRNAMYNYRDRSVKFITYATNVTERTVYGVLAKDRDLSGVKWTGAALLKSYRKWRSKFPTATFDELMDIGGFSEEQRKHLHDLTRSVNRNSDYVTQTDDYDVLSQFPDHREDKSAKEFMAIIDSLNLTVVERDTLMAWAEGKHGAFSKVAAQHINPTTGKPFSRMAISYALKRARNKLEMALRKDEQVVPNLVVRVA